MVENEGLFSDSPDFKHDRIIYIGAADCGYIFIRFPGERTAEHQCPDIRQQHPEGVEANPCRGSSAGAPFIP